MAGTSGVLKSKGVIEIHPVAISDSILSETHSDYGNFASDPEELEIVDELLSQITTKQALPYPPYIVTDIEDYESPETILLPKNLGFEQPSDSAQSQSDKAECLLDNAFTGGKTAHWARFFDTDTDQRLAEARAPQKVTADSSSRARAKPEPADLDTRPPLERFRRPPKKTLSVTDLVSPSWCELQYFYTLSKHGRKRRTPAMKQGTAVHQALEDEVHTTIPIQIEKKEDSWGLRIFNIIQGLKTLEDTGRTRELEIWGTIGGEIVNGVIDEVSYECPDPALEQLKDGTQTQNQAELPEYRSSITDYLLSAAQKQEASAIENTLPSNTDRTTSNETNADRKIYITDVKTRGSPTLPTGSSIRPTILQLHLYHHMLENFVQGNFSLAQLTERHLLDPNETFSDLFIAQIGSLNSDIFQQASSQEEQPEASQVTSTQYSLDILLRHNNLSSLWEFMISQLRRAFLLPPHTYMGTAPTSTPQSVADLPIPSAQPTRLSPILTAEYLAPGYKHVSGTPKKSIGHKSFVFSAAFLKSYLEDSLLWWRGERAAKGVELNEAWKCRSCDFRADCEWIHERDAAAYKQAIERKKMREIAGVEGKITRRSNV